MPDPTSITAAFASVKTALEIAKLIRESSSTLERAELNLRLAEMVSALADAKIELSSVQEVLAQKDALIAELQIAFERRDEVRHVNDGIYRIGEKGGVVGPAHCLRCWAGDHRLRPLVRSAANWRNNECHFCKSQFSGSTTGTFEEEGAIP